MFSVGVFHFSFTLFVYFLSLQWMLAHFVMFTMQYLKKDKYYYFKLNLRKCPYVTTACKQNFDVNKMNHQYNKRENNND